MILVVGLFVLFMGRLVVMLSSGASCLRSVSSFARNTYNVNRVLIAGDANVHLPSLQDHHSCCRCSHCKPTRVDQDISNLFLSNQIMCINPLGHPTHASGTVVDLFLTDTPSLLPEPFVRTPGTVGESDHSFIHLQVRANIVLFEEIEEIVSSALSA